MSNYQPAQTKVRCPTQSNSELLDWKPSFSVRHCGNPDHHNRVGRRIRYKFGPQDKNRRIRQSAGEEGYQWGIVNIGTRACVLTRNMVYENVVGNVVGAQSPFTGSPSIHFSMSVQFRAHALWDDASSPQSQEVTLPTIMSL
jgi:hypothetical protein